MAEGYGLPVFEKPDSQEICFIPSKDYSAFVESYIDSRERVASGADERTGGVSSGEIVSPDGSVLGRHTGIHRFTVGQRKGLGIALGEPLYVIQTDAATSRVVVGKSGELMKRALIASQLNWVSIEGLTNPIRVQAQIRSRHEAADATVSNYGDGSVEVCFQTPQRAITPGQAVVFYDGDRVVGGGWIQESH
jgi:tRNA-specific 2-thiouridylase